jgi:two-component system sensor histidine kinase BaeS
VVPEVETLIGFWDAPRLERVLGNLLGNAIKYSPEGGEITIRIAREEHGDPATAILSVEDRGVGIPQADLSLIFERFRRAGNVESFAGSGIGLAGAKRIVELHGGTIAVTSTEGQGSTFTVRLPIAMAEEVRRPVAVTRPGNDGETPMSARTGSAGQ